MSPKRMLRKDWNSFIFNDGFLAQNPDPDSSGNSFSNVMYAIGYFTQRYSISGLKTETETENYQPPFLSLSRSVSRFTVAKPEL